jgi:hypothetical protein
MTDKKSPGPIPKTETDSKPAIEKSAPLAKEIGGPKGLEPTRYGDWERKGIISDF